MFLSFPCHGCGKSTKKPRVAHCTNARACTGEMVTDSVQCCKRLRVDVRIVGVRSERSGSVVDGEHLNWKLRRTALL